MKTKRKKYSASQKVSIVRELIEGDCSLSEISEKYRVHPTQLTRWKKQLFEGAVETFNRKAVNADQKREKEVKGLKEKLSHKDGIIVELLEENLQLKKNNGDY